MREVGHHYILQASSFLLWDASSFHVLVKVSAGQESIVRELIAHGADVKKVNDKGLTAL